MTFYNNGVRIPDETKYPNSVRWGQVNEDEHMTIHHTAAQKALDETRQAIASMRAMLDDDAYLEMHDYLRSTMAHWQKAVPMLETRVQEEAEGVYRMPFLVAVRLRISDHPDGSTRITEIDSPEREMVMRGMSADAFRAAAAVVHGVYRYFEKD
jgi:hypothetical protein